MTEGMDDDYVEQYLKLAKEIIRKRIEAIQRKRLRHEGSTMPVGRPRKKKIVNKLKIPDQTSPSPISEGSSLSIVATKTTESTIASGLEITERSTTTLLPMHNESSSATLLNQYAPTSIPSLLAVDDKTDLLSHKSSIPSPKPAENHSFDERIHPPSTALTPDIHQITKPTHDQRKSDDIEECGMNPNILIYSSGR